MEDNKFRIGVGIVQCFIIRNSPHFMHHFGGPQYQRELPILTESLKKQAEPIVDALNNGSITVEEAKEKLDKIWI